MRTAQISVEFAMLFTVAVFLMILILSFVPGWLSSANSPVNEARNWARLVKEKTIAASLSSTDFESTITLPDRIGYSNVNASVVAEESLFMIKDSQSGRTLARAFLPTLNSTGGPEVGNSLRIAKEDGKLTITAVEPEG